VRRRRSRPLQWRPAGCHSVQDTSSFRISPACHHHGASSVHPAFLRQSLCRIPREFPRGLFHKWRDPMALRKPAAERGSALLFLYLPPGGLRPAAARERQRHTSPGATRSLAPYRGGRFHQILAWINTWHSVCLNYSYEYNYI
jgi:hypothetical protein